MSHSALAVLVFIASLLSFISAAQYLCNGISYDDPAVCSSSGTCQQVPYTYRQNILVSNNMDTILAAGYTAQITLNTQSLIQDGKISHDCDDIRIFYYTGASTVELSRHIQKNSQACNSNATRIWFKLQKGIPALGAD